MILSLLFLGSNFARFLNLRRSLNGNRGLLALFKLIDAPSCIQKLLLAGVKRVALAADFRMQRRGCRAGGKFVAAGAGNHNGGIELRMDGGFHRELNKIK